MWILILFLLARSEISIDAQPFLTLKISNTEAFCLLDSETGNIFFSRSQNDEPSIKNGKNLTISSPTISKNGKSFKIEGILERAFADSNLKTVSISIPLRKFGDAVFSGCEKLEKVDLRATELLEIPSFTFYKCKSLKEILLPSQLVNISYMAFSFCSIQNIIFSQSLKLIETSSFEESGLKEVKLGNTNIQTILPSTFRRCINLSKIEFSNNLAKISSSAFSQTALESITLGKSISSLESFSFCACSKLKTVDLSQTKLSHIASFIFQYDFALEKVILPNSVKLLQDDAFSYTGLKSFSFSSHIISIGNYVLRSCPNLVSVDFSKSQSNDVPKGLVFDCYKFNTVEFNEMITEILDFAFANTAISEINFPNSLKSIKNYAFFNCSNIQKLSLASTDLVEIGNFTFADCLNLNSVKFSNSITKLGKFAFSNTGFTNVEVSGDLSSIGQGAYSKCLKLKSVDLTNIAVDALPPMMFENCTNLNEILWPSYQIIIGERSFFGIGINTLSLPTTISFINNGAFQNCKKLKSINLNNIMFDDLPDLAFADCSSLSDITLSQGAMKLGKYVFKGTALNNFTFRASMVSIGSFALQGCVNLKVADMSKIRFSYIPDGLFKDCSNLKNLTWPTNKFAIGNYCFSNTSIVSFKAPQNLVGLGNYAFSYNNKLVSANLSTVYFQFGTHLFYKCPKLNNLTFPAKFNFALTDYCLSGTSIENINITDSSITKLGAGTFESCKKLTFVNFTELNLEILPMNLFRNCFKLETVLVPYKIAEIDDYCFENCKSLTDFNFTLLCDTIGYRAFTGCALTSIELPDSTYFIEEYSFCNNKNLTRLNLQMSSVSIISKYAFCNCTNLAEILLPTDSHAIFSYAFSNTGIKTLVVDELTTLIAPFAYYSCKKLKSANLQKYNGQAVYMSVFANCSKLAEITLPANAKEIGEKSFVGCRFRLLNMSKIAKIGKMAFEGCHFLEEVHFDKTEISYVPEFCFYDCPNLTTVVLPDTAVTLKDYCFANTGLTKLITKRISVLGNGVFKNTKLESFSFSEVQEIGDNCFEKTLISVAILPKLTDIGVACFNNTKMKFIDLRDSEMIELNLDAFSGSNLEYLILPDTLKAINGTLPGTLIYYCGDGEVTGTVKQFEGFYIKSNSDKLLNTNTTHIEKCPKFPYDED